MSLRAASLGFSGCRWVLLGSQKLRKIPGTDPLLGLMEAHLPSLPSTSAQIRGLAKLGGSLRRQVLKGPYFVVLQPKCSLPELPKNFQILWMVRLWRLSFRQLVLLSRGLDVPGVQAALAALRSGI